MRRPVATYVYREWNDGAPMDWPAVICDDGSVFQYDGANWRELSSIPGTAADPRTERDEETEAGGLPALLRYDGREWVDAGLGVVDPHLCDVIVGLIDRLALLEKIVAEFDAILQGDSSDE